jgi:hypothetical protein
VAKPRATSDERVAGLYREHPERFVARRNELVKELRAGGERDEAERLRTLRRPTATAWLINRVARDSTQLVEEFAAASRAVEDAQRRALEGDDEATSEWRSAAARERAAAAAVAKAAERSAREAGHPASPRSLELVLETLRAAGGDRELRDRVLHGRVEREQSAATLGIPTVPTSLRRAAGSTKRSDAARARREQRSVEGELEAAAAREDRLRGRVERAAEALRAEKAKLSEARRETAALRRRLKTLERRAHG